MRDYSLTFERLATALLFLAIGAGACFAPAQSDTWWRLRTGQAIWETGTVDLTDRLSHTVAGGYWPNHEWLSQVLFYAGYRAGGLPLLTALTASVIVAAWLLIWRLTPGGYPYKHMLFAVALIPSSMAWSLRPQVFTLILVATTAFLLARRRYLLLPLLFLLWANLHGGVMLGLVLLAGAGVALMFEAGKWPPGRLVVASIGCVAVTVITPLGLSIWTEIPASLARLQMYGVREWRAPSLTDPPLLPFWLVAVLLIVLSVRAKPWTSTAVRSNATFWAALALLPLALSSGRNVPPFLLIAVPAIAAMQSSRMTRALPPVERPVFNTGILVAMTMLAVSSVTYAWVSEVPRLQWHPLPEQVIASLKSCPDPLYNRYDEGGYVIWFVPERKVFLDSRQDPYPAALVNEQIRVEQSGDYQTLFNRFAIRCVLTPADSVLARRLLADGWEEAYKGHSLVVLTGRPPLD